MRAFLKLQKVTESAATDRNCGHFTKQCRKFARLGLVQICSNICVFHDNMNIFNEFGCMKTVGFSTLYDKVHDHIF